MERHERKFVTATAGMASYARSILPPEIEPVEENEDEYEEEDAVLQWNPFAWVRPRLTGDEDRDTMLNRLTETLVQMRVNEQIFLDWPDDVQEFNQHINVPEGRIPPTPDETYEHMRTYYSTRGNTRRIFIELYFSFIHVQQSAGK